MKYNLLSDGKINHKIKKNIKLGYNTYSLNFAHSDLSGFNVCPTANKMTEQENNLNKSNCSYCCVGYNGFASIYSDVMESRIKKTISYYLDRESFLETLTDEITLAIEESNKKGLKPSFRLNAYSDIRWENHIIKDNKTIFDLFSKVKFYDYTKLNNRKTPKNYQLTFSHYGDWNKTSSSLKSGVNCAIVFEKLPKYITIDGLIYIVIDGDETDLRLDEKINNKSVVVGLKFKGSKKKLNDAILEGFALSKDNESLKYSLNLY
jgi:hypothetical protein